MVSPESSHPVMDFFRTTDEEQTIQLAHSRYIENFSNTSVENPDILSSMDFIRTILAQCISDSLSEHSIEHVALKRICDDAYSLRTFVTGTWAYITNQQYWDDALEMSISNE